MVSYYESSVRESDSWTTEFLLNNSQNFHRATNCITSYRILQIFNVEPLQSTWLCATCWCKIRIGWNLSLWHDVDIDKKMMLESHNAPLNTVKVNIFAKRNFHDFWDFDIVREFNFAVSTPIIFQHYYKRLFSQVFIFAFLSLLAKIKVSQKFLLLQYISRFASFIKNHGNCSLDCSWNHLLTFYNQEEDIYSGQLPANLHGSVQQLFQLRISTHVAPSCLLMPSNVAGK